MHRLTGSGIGSAAAGWNDYKPLLILGDFQISLSYSVRHWFLNCHHPLHTACGAERLLKLADTRWSGSVGSFRFVGDHSPIRAISMKNPPCFQMSDKNGGMFHNLTQGFHYSGSEMLKNKGGFFHNGGIFS